MIKPFKHFFLSISLISMFSPLAAYANDNMTLPAEKSYADKWWVNLGVGEGQSHGSGDNINGVSSTASFNYQTLEHQLLTLRYDTVGDIVFGSSLKDVGLLYGLIAKNDYAYASASAGLAWVQYDKDEGLVSTGPNTWTQSTKTVHTVGIPGELQFFVTPFRYVGFGVVVFGNLNKEQSFSGAALAIQIGDLR